MAITLDGTLGVTAPTYAGTITSEYSVPVTAFKNRIINGAMMIDQRNAGASITSGYPVDRFQIYSTQSSKWTAQQSTTAPTGFKNSVVITSSGTYSPTSSDYFSYVQRIEGYNVSDMGFGTASASTFTVSFWVRSSLTGTFGGALHNNAFDRVYAFSYTINAANTWEQKTVTIAGDTTGTWTTDNSVGLEIGFAFSVGSSGLTTAGSWSGTANIFSATGQTNLLGTSGATFYITGVQLEKGSTATSFDYRPYGTELALCQRYFQISSFSGVAYNTTEMGIASQFKVTMRAQPSMSTVLYNGDNYTGTANNIVRVGVGNITTTSASYNATSSGNNIGNMLTTGLTANGVYFGSFQASAEL